MVDSIPRPPSEVPIAAIPYVVRPSLQNGATVGLQAAGVGLLVSTVQNALDTHSRGAAGVFTRTGGTVGFFAAMGATFAFTDSAVSNIRQKDDALNGVAGGCAAGFLAGMRARSIPVAVASCAIIGGMVGSFDAAGRSLTGDGRSLATRPDREERRKQFFKKKLPIPGATDDAEAGHAVSSQ